MFPAVWFCRSVRDVSAVGFWTVDDEGSDDDVEDGLLTQLDKISDSAVITIIRFMFGL